MSWYDKLQIRISNDEFINSARSDFESYLDNAPNTVDVYKNYNDAPIKVTIQEESLSTDKNDYIKIMLSKITDIFEVGDIVTWKTHDWIVIWKDIKSIENNNKVKIQQCNNILKFYDKHFNLLEVPCVVHDSLLSDENNRFITLSTDEYLINCPNNDKSKYINENTRFILNSEAYKVIGVDSLKRVGLLEIKIKKDSITVDDNVDLGIADWRKNNPTYEISILNGESAKLNYQNATLQLQVEVKINGEVINNPELVYASTNNNIASVTQGGLITCMGTGNCIVTATYKSVSDSIVINGDIVAPAIYGITISPTDSSLKVGRSMTLEAHAMNNGVEDLTRHFVWTLFNSDGTQNTYATIQPNDKTCVLSAKSIANKSIIVRATLSNDNSKYIDKEIKIINLF